jgi:hypothetical protein
MSVVEILVSGNNPNEILGSATIYNKILLCQE